MREQRIFCFGRGSRPYIKVVPPILSCGGNAGSFGVPREAPKRDSVCQRLCVAPPRQTRWRSGARIFRDQSRRQESTFSKSWFPLVNGMQCKIGSHCVVSDIYSSFHCPRPLVFLQPSWRDLVWRFARRGCKHCISNLNAASSAVKQN